jgi:hypothetical protein
MWACPNCHEQHEDHFDTCWNCGAARDGSLDPNSDHGAATAEERKAAWLKAAGLPEHTKPAEQEVPHSRGKTVTSTRCAKCGSDCVVPRATIWDQGGEGTGGPLQAYVYSNPGALIFKGATYATLFARICGQCGHVELFAKGAGKLYESYRQSKETDRNP